MKPIYAYNYTAIVRNFAERMKDRIFVDSLHPSKDLLLYGLQRSGTNYFERTLKENFVVNFLNSDDDRRHPIQKHFRIFDDKSLTSMKDYSNDSIFESFADFENAVGVKVSAYMIISKDPYSWFLSYRSWAEKCNWPAFSSHPAKEYEAFYQKWMDFAAQSDQVHFVKYIDLLEEPEEALLKIGEKLELHRRVKSKISLQTPEKVPQSKNFSDAAKRFYTEKEYLRNFTEREIGTINEYVSDKTFAALGYERYTEAMSETGADSSN